jgi:hypothetical protein
MNLIRSLMTLAVLFAATAVSQAQYVVLPPPVVSYSPPPVYYPPAPVVNYSYYPAPAPVYAPPAVSYYAPPTVSYYAPAPVAYPVYSAPVGSYVTRTYTGYGIFRPRGTYTESYYRPW